MNNSRNQALPVEVAERDFKAKALDYPERGAPVLLTNPERKQAYVH